MRLGFGAGLAFLITLGVFMPVLAQEAQPRSERLRRFETSSGGATPITEETQRYEGPERRVFFFPTALAPQKGHGSILDQDLFFLNLSFGVHDQLAVGGALYCPILSFGLFPSLLHHLEINKNWEFGVFAQGGYGVNISRTEGDSSEVSSHLWAFGGGPLFTYHASIHTLTMGVLGFTGGRLGGDGKAERLNGRRGLFLPFVGYSLLIKNTKQQVVTVLFFEATPPFIYTPDRSFANINVHDFTLVFTYGLRVNWPLFFLEFCATLPISRWWYGYENGGKLESAASVLPFGVPTLGFGFHY